MLTITLFTLPCTLASYSLISGDFGESSGYEVTLDQYYSSAELYTGIAKEPIPYLGEEDESEIYKYLWKNAFLPKFLLFEVSFYPLPCTSVAIKKNFRNFYDSFDVSEDFNLIQAACEGLEEPAGFSVFLGNLVSFKPKNVKQEKKGKAYMGYLATIGNYHIKDSELVEDNWIEFEWKIKGDRITDKRIMKWSYRVGTKQHGNPEIADVLYFSITRDRIDFLEKSKSIFNNANIEYICDINYDNLEIVRHFFLVGKSYPIKNKKLAFQLKAGFILEESEKYSGSLKREAKESNLSIMIRPLLKF